MGQRDNTEELEKLRNIGPRTAARLIEAGVPTVAELKRLGAVAAYRRLKHASPRETTLLALYALHAALTDSHWNELPDPVKQSLR